MTTDKAQGSSGSWRWRIVATALFVLVFVNGYLIGHYVVQPPPVVTGSQADGITKYCTELGTGNIPAPFNGFIPAQYKNGTYTLYSCKVGSGR